MSESVIPVEELERLAPLADWKCSLLAPLLRVSNRTLRRQITRQFGKSPYRLLGELDLKQ